MSALDKESSSNTTIELKLKEVVEFALCAAFEATSGQRGLRASQ